MDPPPEPPPLTGFDQLPPLDSTLTIVSNPSAPLDTIPTTPTPSISILFPEITPYRIPDNPFRDSNPKRISEIHKKSLQDALGSIRGPYLFNLEESYDFNGANVGTDTTAESFNSAVTMVIAALERGYHPNRDPTPLKASNWARLGIDILAAIGRGYHRQYTPDQEATLEKVREVATDPVPLSGAYLTLFHCLAATAEELGFHIETDAKGQRQKEGYQDWYSTLKNTFTKKATKAAAAEVEEKWLVWKANEIDRLTATFKKDLGMKARERGKDYFIDTAEKLGLQLSREGTLSPTPPQTAGHKCTASGSMPNIPQPTPDTPIPIRVSLPRAAKRTSL